MDIQPTQPSPSSLPQQSILPRKKPSKKIIFIVFLFVLLIVSIGIYAFTFLNKTRIKLTPVTKITYTQESTPLIPRKVLFGNPDKSLVRLSPDGTKISFLSDVNGVANVWVGPVGNPSQAKPVTNDKSRGIDTYKWAYTNNHIIFLQDENGDENWRVNSVDLTTGQIKTLTPLKGVAAQIQQISPKVPNEILVGLNDRDPQLYDIYRINILTGEKKLVMQNDEGYVGFVTDNDYKVRLADQLKPNGDVEILQPDGKGAWKPFTTIPFEDVNSSDFLGFDKSGNTLFMKDTRKSNTAALTAVDMTTGDTKVLATDEQSDLDSELFDPMQQSIQAVTFYYDRQKWQVLDNQLKADFDYLQSVAKDEMLILSRTLDDKYWMIANISDNGPFNYYLYDRTNKKAKFLFNSRNQLGNYPLANMHSVTIKSRDGLNLVSYLTLPIWANDNNSDKPKQPFPMILDVHGGPWVRDLWGYNPEHQWLANRGYAVLSVNYRGSSGFGKQLLNAGNKEWAGKMHDDLIDAVNWAISNGIADPKRVAIYGGSYGGYEALVGLTFTPDVFAAGVDEVGPSNLLTFMNTIPAYWQPQIDLLKKQIGDPTTPEGQAFLKERSPLTFADRITKPLLIAQGANDPRVKQAESDQIVEVMKKKKIPVTYLLYTDEGHGFARPENQFSFYAVTEAFLTKILGGRVEPFNDSFMNSSINVVAGSEFIPGLKEASQSSIKNNK